MSLKFIFVLFIYFLFVLIHLQSITISSPLQRVGKKESVTVVNHMVSHII